MKPLALAALLVLASLAGGFYAGQRWGTTNTSFAIYKYSSDGAALFAGTCGYDKEGTPYLDMIDSRGKP